jgi:MFS family permease
MGVGVGEAALSPSAYSLIGDAFPRERLGRALGVYNMGIPIGSGLALILGGLVVNAVSTSDAVYVLPLLGEVRSSAESAGLTIVEETLMPAEGGQAAVLQTKVGGPFAGFATFLFGLQSPGAWKSIDRILIRSDKEPPNVIAEIVVRQHYNERETTP